MSHWGLFYFGQTWAEPHSDTNSCLIVNQKKLLRQSADLPSIWRPRFSGHSAVLCATSELSHLAGTKA